MVRRGDTCRDLKEECPWQRNSKGGSPEAGTSMLIINWEGQLG